MDGARSEDIGLTNANPVVIHPNGPRLWYQNGEIYRMVFHGEDDESYGRRTRLNFAGPRLVKRGSNETEVHEFSSS